MLWFYLMLIIVAGFTLRGIWSTAKFSYYAHVRQQTKAEDKTKESGYHSWYDNFKWKNYPTTDTFWGILITVGVWFVISLVPTAGYIYSANNVQNSQYVIEAKTAQRDALMAEVEDKLSNEDYVQLINAAHPDDIKSLRTRPEVTGYLLGRFDRIVSLNGQLFKEQNELLAQARGVCNFVGNVLIPQIPGIRPECKLGTLQETFLDAQKLPEEEEVTP